MHKSALLNEEDTFPSKNYSKYRSQAKTNPFLHKLNQDVGYPQDVLSTHSTIIVRNDRNYLDLNKKNLKNFFSDRLPPKEVDIYRENFTIDPSRLFQIKKRQHELKAQTRSKLEEKLDTKCNPGKLNPKKITENFQYNDKNQEFKKRVLGSEGVKIVQPYQPNNFLRGTTSYVSKYNEITKKRAYNSVFGPQASAYTRKTMTARSSRQNSNFSRPFTTIEARKKFSSNSGSKDIDRKKKFTSLIKKIDGYRKNLDPQNRRGMREYIAPKEPEDTELLKTQLITWIKDTAKSYKNNSIQNNREHIHNVQDLMKIDQDFYKDLKKHKAKRLSHRSNYVQNLLVHNYTARNSTRQQKNIDFDSKSNHSLSQASRHQSEQYSISSNQQEEQVVDPLNKHNPAYLLKKFIRLLVDALTQARFYGIQNKQNIYKAFWKNPDPYEKSGSYAFFKAVKKGELQAIKAFLRIDPDYIYERDHKGRSPLILATMNNHRHVINYILECDVNVNKRCFNLKTSLYYAIRNENVEIVKNLLQKGALPWSTKSCRYNKMLQKIKNHQIENLMKNARKIGILIQMQPNKTQKVTLWTNLKHKITENEIISFQ